MDVAPSQIVSAAAALIPFLEHDDANRALMGSNMQRQAVPLLQPKAPIVGTGMEQRVARDSRALILAEDNGVVEYVDSDKIIVKYDVNPNSIETLTSFNTVRQKTYTLIKFHGTNQETCMTQRPIVKEGQRVAEGDVLADGSLAAAKRIAEGTEKYAMQIKGLELPGYDVRGAKAHGLNYATAFTGADHNRGYAFQEIFGIPIPYAVDRFTTEDKGKLTKWNQDVRTATADCPTMCVFLLDMAVPHFATENTASLMEAVTALTYTPEEIQKVGERINNLGRLYNIREGLTRKDDTLPKRLLNEPSPSDPGKGLVANLDHEGMLPEYYAFRGYDQAGLPTRKRLADVCLADIADELSHMGKLSGETDGALEFATLVKYLR